MKKWFLSIFIFLIPLAIHADPLPASEAFQLSIQQVEPQSLTINWAIKPSYYLYKEHIEIGADSNKDFELGALNLPPSVTKTDKLGHENAIYKDQLSLSIPVTAKRSGESLLNVRYQGCSFNGFCYPPEHKQITLAFNDKLELTGATIGSMSTAKANKTKTALKATASTAASQDKIGRIFTSHNWLVILIIFYGFGLLLSFTPCILPMVPVLSGIVVGHGSDVTTKKAFFLSLSYVISMSLTYAIVGAIVALLGANVQVSMQSPWAISLFSLLFVLLALSMFDFYEFKLPQSWRKNPT